jgi:hypothetical protein
VGVVSVQLFRSPVVCLAGRDRINWKTHSEVMPAALKKVSASLGPVAVRSSLLSKSTSELRGPAQIEFGLNLIVCRELEGDTQTTNFALLQIDWCIPAPCLRRLLLLVCCSVAFDPIEV